MKISLRDFIISLLSSIVSGIILNSIKSFFSDEILNNLILGCIIILAVLIGILVYLLLFVQRCYSHGIIKILGSSVKGEGSTASYMKNATSSIRFVGIAASKWVRDADLLEKTIRSICSQNTGYIHFLLLNPDSDAAKKLTIAQNNSNEQSVSAKIQNSLDKITEIVNRISDNDVKLLDRFEIRLYNQMPVFRLTIINNTCAYFCFYQKGCDGSKLKQFVIKPKRNVDSSQENIFNSMSEYFDSLWSSKETVVYSVQKEQQYNILT